MVCHGDGYGWLGWSGRAKMGPISCILAFQLLFRVQDFGALCLPLGPPLSCSSGCTDSQLWACSLCRVTTIFPFFGILQMHNSSGVFQVFVVWAFREPLVRIFPLFLWCGHFGTASMAVRPVQTMVGFLDEKHCGTPVAHLTARYALLPELEAESLPWHTSFGRGTPYRRHQYDQL